MYQLQPSLLDAQVTQVIGALDEVVVLELSGISGGKAAVSGTWVGTIKFEQTIDDVTWFPVGSFSGTTGAVLSQTGITTNDVVVFVGIAGVLKIRARFHAYTSGSATVTLRGSNGVSNVFVNNLVPGNLKTQTYTNDGAGVAIGSVGDRLKVDAEVSNSVAIQSLSVSRVDYSNTVTASGNSGTLSSEGLGCLSYDIRVTAASGTNKTMQISIETSEDGTNWDELTNTRRFTATGGQNHDNIAIGPKYYRYSWVVAGSSPSFTFSIRTTLKDYLPRRNITIDKYSDVIINSLNATSSVFQSADCTNISLFTVRSDDGGSTTQYKVQASNNTVNWVDVSGAISQARATTQLTQFPNVAFRYFRIVITAAANVANTLDLYWSAGG